ncbi:unnamed protein product [Miscanthus lutarioriparius]|uniref:Myb/SANT-like domain-containing protein n=1 Tax=Miscanthus lutarioriparius TaxID=422564 RepID=A0A811NNP6_9POAL|nr:unnamed protein product [Miscanthus lutarioriparius]
MSSVNANDGEGFVSAASLVPGFGMAASAAPTGGAPPTIVVANVQPLPAAGANGAAGAINAGGGGASRAHACVYNHLRKWRQRWGRVCKLKELSGALWDDDTKAIMLDQDHYAGHVKDHPKDVEYLNTPIRFYDEMETIFGSACATRRFAVGSNEPLGVSSNTTDIAAGKMEGTFGHQQLGDEKANHGESSKATEPNSSVVGGKWKRACFSEDEMLIMTNMTDVVNNVANALRETGPAHVDADLYHAVMDMPEFTEEALIVAFSHLLDNKA